MPSKFRLQTQVSVDTFEDSYNQGWCYYHNQFGDALTRIEINTIFQHAAKIDWHTFAKAQQNDYELTRYLDETISVSDIEHEWIGAALLYDVSRDGTPRPWVPCGFRCIVFDNCHNATHCSICATVK